MTESLKKDITLITFDSFAIMTYISQAYGDQNSAKQLFAHLYRPKGNKHSHSQFPKR